MCSAFYILFSPHFFCLLTTPSSSPLSYILFIVLLSFCHSPTLLSSAIWSLPFQFLSVSASLCSCCLILISLHLSSCFNLPYFPYCLPPSLFPFFHLISFSLFIFSPHILSPPLPPPPQLSSVFAPLSPVLSLWHVFLSST